MYVLSRDFFFFFFIVRLLGCLGMAGNNHPKTERGTTADDGLSTRKSSWWCLCYVISGNAADGGSFFLHSQSHQVCSCSPPPLFGLHVKQRQCRSPS